MASSSTRNTAINISTAIASQVVTVILSFFTRTALIRTLGIQAVSLNGLFGEIITMLSLAELGVGSAIIYHLYKPLAENDEKRVCQLMTLFQTAYRIIALVIFTVGLLLTPFGVSDNTGNTAWLKFPGIPVSIGPAEVVKISFVLLLARQIEWLRLEKRDLQSFRAALFAAGHTFLLMGYYFVISGDMGNALVFFFIFLAMAFAAGFALRWFALLLGGGGAAMAAVFLLNLVPSSMKYMLDRFVVVFDHSYDPLGKGWQQSRSLLAIGSGGVLGQGYLQGTQTHSSYKTNLPARHTDLIFAVCGEELGLVGCVLVIVLLAAIIIRVLLVAKRAETPFQSYVCVGMAAMLMFQTIINIGMCLFVVPVIGITLPFFSYGGSSIVTLFAAMGVVSSIKKRSPTMRRTTHRLRT